MLFPLLTKLLENISPADIGGMEETRMRASTLLSKVQDLLLHISECEVFCAYVKYITLKVPIIIVSVVQR